MTTIAPETPEGLPEYTRKESQEIEQRFGESPRFIRRISETQVTFDGVAFVIGGLSDSLAEKIGIAFGDAHPSIPGAFATEFFESEVEDTSTVAGAGFSRTRELSVVYTVPQIAGRPIETAAPGSGSAGAPEVSPLARPDTWSFLTQGASVPALFYYNDQGQSKPLTNSAYDYLRGLQVDEAQTKVIIKGNRLQFPKAQAIALTNCVNEGAFLGGPQDSWKCQGIQGELKYETVAGNLVRYWEVTVELMYRQTGWNLLIPDIGFNYLEGGTKKRAFVWFDDPEQGLVKIASSDPVPLNGSGAISAAGEPAILNRRVYKRVDFSTYFGEPPQ
jgi:hypothetical protein